jgi:hypothetical protein
LKGLKTFLEGGHGAAAEAAGWTKAFTVPKLWSQIAEYGGGLLIADREIVNISVNREIEADEIEQFERALKGRIDAEESADAGKIRKNISTRKWRKKRLDVGNLNMNANAFNESVIALLTAIVAIKSKTYTDLGKVS